MNQHQEEIGPIIKKYKDPKPDPDNSERFR